MVILLHGVFDSAGCWVQVMEALADAGFRAVAVDLPGHGRSPRTEDLSVEGLPAEGLSVVAMAESVAATMDSLGLDGATVIGHSMGGLVAQELAVSHPSRATRLVLEDPA